MNKDYIAKNLCENRDKPKMHCNGKCCLRKKLAREGKEQAPANNLKNELTLVLFYHDATIHFNKAFIVSDSHTYISRNDLRTFSYNSSIFHPPGV